MFCSTVSSVGAFYFAFFAVRGFERAVFFLPGAQCRIFCIGVLYNLCARFLEDKVVVYTRS